MLKENKEQDIVKIKVVGIGRCGVNTVANIANGDETGKFIAIDTDIETLEKLEGPKKLLIGEALTKGLGTRANYEKGREVALENKEEIESLLDDTDILFIVSGMGGGTGTGVTPVVAEIAKQRNIITIAIVIAPFSFEGIFRNALANDGIEALKSNVDTLITIKNDDLLSNVAKNTPMKEVFAVLDDAVIKVIGATEDLIVFPALFNLDFRDFASVIKNKGIGQIAIGKGSGENRAKEAAQNLLKSQFLNLDLKRAKSILLSIASDYEVSLVEVNEVINVVEELTNVDTNIMFGVSIKEELKDKMIITAIATGFEE